VGTLPRRQPPGVPPLRYLFDDPGQLELDFYQKYGYVPANHLVVMQRDRYATEPRLAVALYRAFDEAKNAAVDALCDFGFPPVSVPQAYHAVRGHLEAFGDDPWPYGLAANRASLQALLDACRTQGLLRDELAVTDLFVPELHES
jgi:4,5-dihydroxyphthalate decarboxylase